MPNDGLQLRKLAGHQDTVRGLVFTPDGKLLSAGSDGTVKQWNPAADEKPSERLKSARGLMALTLAHDGKSFANVEVRRHGEPRHAQK